MWRIRGINVCYAAQTVETSLRTTPYQSISLEPLIRVVDQKLPAAGAGWSVKGTCGTLMVNKNASRTRCKNKTSFSP